VATVGCSTCTQLGPLLAGPPAHTDHPGGTGFWTLPTTEATESGNGEAEQDLKGAGKL